MKLSRIIQLVILVVLCLIGVAIFSGGSSDAPADSTANSGPTP